MAMLLVPLIFIDWHGGKLSEEENRMLATRPPKSLLIESPIIFTEEINAWFSDNIGFRKGMITLYKQIDSIEKEGQYQRGDLTFLIGEKGHEYYDYNATLISKYQGKPFLTEEELSDLAANLNEIKEYLDAKCIPMIVMFCTDKETIYPEYYPKSIMRGPEPIQLDIITDYLKMNTDIDVFNIKQSLLDQKNNYLLYDKALGKDGLGNITHYNEMGGFFAYQELMRHINKYLPEIDPFTIDDVSILYDKNGSLIVDLKDDVSYKALANSFSEKLEGLDIEPWRYYNIENENKDLPNILIMRDSYISLKYTAMLPEHFSKTGFVHYRYMNRFIEFVEYYNPDIVVFQSAERQLRIFSEFIDSNWCNQ